MDYYTKYIKYKGKYLASQTGGSFADATGILIPPELQALDDAFLPGFNIDKAYVEPLLAGALFITKSFVSYESQKLINFLRDLNNLSTDGLCAKGDRLNAEQNNKKKMDHLQKKI
jgi:hypothetical protein